MNLLRQPKLLLVTVGIFVTLGTILIFTSRAATPTVSIEPESGTVTVPASINNDTAASRGRAVLFGTTATPTPPPTGGGCPAWPAHPDANCTGIPAGVTLADVPATSITSGGTYTNKRFTSIDYITITDSNLTFVNCSFPRGAVFRSGSNIKISHSDFAGGISFSSAHAIDFRNNNVHDFDDGIDITSDSGSMASSVTLVENYIHHPTAVAPDHSDGMQVRGVAGLIVTHNTFDEGVWYIDGGLNVLNSAIYYQDANGGNTGIVTNNNYLNGGGYALYPSGGAGSITNNMFGPDAHYGFVSTPVDPKFTRSGNITSTGQAVNF